MWIILEGQFKIAAIFVSVQLKKSRADENETCRTLWLVTHPEFLAAYG